MKVHIVINDVSRSGGGAQKVALELQAGVLGRGVSSTLVALESLDRSAPLEPGLRSLNCSVRRPGSALVALVRYFRSEVRDGDVIHVHLFPSLLLVPMAQRLARRSCRLVMTEHNTVNGRRGRWIGRLVDSLIYPRYDAIVCIEYFLDRANLCQDLLRTDAHVIPTNYPSFNDWMQRASALGIGGKN